MPANKSTLVSLISQICKSLHEAYLLQDLSHTASSKIAALHIPSAVEELISAHFTGVIQPGQGLSAHRQMELIPKINSIKAMGKDLHQELRKNPLLDFPELSVFVWIHKPSHEGSTASIRIDQQYINRADPPYSAEEAIALTQEYLDELNQVPPQAIPPGVMKKFVINNGEGTIHAPSVEAALFKAQVDNRTIKSIYEALDLADAQESLLAMQHPAAAHTKHLEIS